MRQAKIPASAAALRKGQSSHKQQAERARPDQGQSQGHLSNMLPERGRGRARITSSSRWRCALRLKQVAVQVGVEPAAVQGGTLADQQMHPIFPALRSKLALPVRKAEKLPPTPMPRSSNGTARASLGRNRKTTGTWETLGSEGKETKNR